jgi:hypothetical protein
VHRLHERVDDESLQLHVAAENDLRAQGLINKWGECSYSDDQYADALERVSNARQT